jgi:hypothetical protein
MFHNSWMLYEPIQTTAAHIAQAIRSAPSWTKLGLSVRDERLRERAVDELALVIAGGLEDAEVPSFDWNQLALPL